jgi:hypothetical protein
MSEWSPSRPSCSVLPSQERLWSMETNGTKGKLLEQLGQCLIYGRLTFKGVCLCSLFWNMTTVWSTMLAVTHRLPASIDRKLVSYCYAANAINEMILNKPPPPLASARPFYRKALDSAKNTYCARCDVLTVVLLTIPVLWDVQPGRRASSFRQFLGS